MKKVIIGISLGVLALASSILGFSSALKQKAQNTTYKSWMSEKLNDNDYIKDVNIPGTHDTISLRSIGDLAGKCQTLDLYDQLNIGVRFLDIRLQNVNDELKGIHGFIDQKISFASIVYTVESFLKENNREFIIMSIKEEEKAKGGSKSFDALLKEYLKSDYWRLDTSVPEKVGEVRGKIVVMSRYSGSTIGIPAYEGWNDNSTFNLPNNIHVQDNYKLKTTEEKKNAIKTCLADTGDYALKINFLSGYLDGGFPPSYAPSVANDINPWITGELKGVAKRGIVLYDFVTSSLMKGWFE